MRRRRKRVGGQKTGGGMFWRWLPWILSSLTWWSILVVIFTSIEPARLRDLGLKGAYLPLFIPVFFSVFSVLFLIWRNMLRGVLWSFLITIYLVLRVWGLGEWFNALLLVGLGVAVEYYRKVDISTA